MVVDKLIKEIENRIELKHEAYVLIEHITGFNK